MGSTRQETYYDTGSAARYFYCAKSSRSEREAGLDELDSVQRVCYNETILLEQGEVSLLGKHGPHSVHPSGKGYTTSKGYHRFCILGLCHQK